MYLIHITWADGEHDSAVTDSVLVALEFTRWENARNAEIWRNYGQGDCRLLMSY